MKAYKMKGGSAVQVDECDFVGGDTPEALMAFVRHNIRQNGATVFEIVQTEPWLQAAHPANTTQLSGAGELSEDSDLKEKIIAQIKETRHHLTCLEAEAKELFSLAHTSDDLRTILSKFSDLEGGLRGAALPLSNLCDAIIAHLGETNEAAEQTLGNLLDNLRALMSTILTLSVTQENKQSPAHLVNNIPTLLNGKKWKTIWADAATLQDVTEHCNRLWIYLQGNAKNDMPAEGAATLQDSPLVGQLERLVKAYRLRIIDLKATTEVSTMTVAEVAKKLGGFEALRDDYSRRNRNRHAYDEEVFFWTRALAIKQQQEVEDQKTPTSWRRMK